MSKLGDEKKTIGETFILVHKVTLSKYYPTIYNYIGKDYKFSITDQNRVSLGIIANLIKINKCDIAIITAAFRHILDTPELHGIWCEL